MGVALMMGLTTVASLALGAPSFADSRAVIDRDDSLSPLDIAAVEHAHAGRALTFEVVTYEAWDPAEMSGASFLIRINLDSDSQIERLIIIRSQEQGLEAKVYGPKGGESEENFRGSAATSRPDDHSFRIVVERGLLKKKLRSFAWQVQSSVQVQDPPCDGESGGCQDYAPARKRFIRHDVRR